MTLISSIDAPELRIANPEYDDGVIMYITSAVLVPEAPETHPHQSIGTGPRNNVQSLSLAAAREGVIAALGCICSINGAVGMINDDGVADL